jgi:hypothetical protein
METLRRQLSPVTPRYSLAVSPGRACFERLWLSAHRICSPDEPLLSEVLAGTPLWKSIAVDPGEIAAAVAILANRRQPVIDIALGADASLTIHLP